MADKGFMPERAQQLWEMGFAPSRIDEFMEWPQGRCHDLAVEHWKRLPVQLLEEEDDELW